MSVTKGPDTESGPGRRRIPCLDGLRAISIALVLLDHGRKNSRVNGFPRLDWIPFTGTAGVCLFFMISGFLITALLLNEKEVVGKVVLPKFYVRRALRIFPPFYFYILAGMLARSVGWIHFSAIGLLSSATYWRNLYNGPACWFLDHTWSLSIEEQFYLIWPLMIARLSIRQSTAIAVCVIAAWPILRLLRHGFLFAGSGHVALETAAMDTILYGSLLALLVHAKTPLSLPKRMARHPVGLYLSVVVLYGLYSTAERWPHQLTFLLPLLRNISLCWFLWWCITNADSRFGRALEWRPIVTIGLISYSLYLWQQPFLGFYRGWICMFPQNVVAAFLVATLSYRTIERPFNRIRHHWSVS
jgi:peptidoglycan/LPS O-acetylase OafA/YrhL